MRRVSPQLGCLLEEARPVLSREFQGSGLPLDLEVINDDIELADAEHMIEIVPEL